MTDSNTNIQLSVLHTAHLIYLLKRDLNLLKVLLHGLVLSASLVVDSQTTQFECFALTGIIFFRSLCTDQFETSTSPMGNPREVPGAGNLHQREGWGGIYSFSYDEFKCL